MKEIKRILELYEQIDLTRRKVALATVVYVWGSAYRRPGARMLISDDGRWEGAISGGCLEGDALRKARRVMLEGKPIVVRYDTMHDDANSLGVGLGCNGIIDVFIEPIDPTDSTNPIARLREFMQRRDRRVMATVVLSGWRTGLTESTRFVFTQLESVPDQAEPVPAEPVPDWLADDMAQVMQLGKPMMQTYEVGSGVVDVFIERIDPGIDLVIFGAGYDTIPLARLATELGWSVTITEDCIAHLSPKRFPQATCLLYADARTVTQKLTLTDRTAAVLMSHNYRYDLAVLTELLPTNVSYIGILGPRKRYEKMQAEWAKTDKTFKPQWTNRVHSPIGLDIGAETPDEIALSILSEIKAFFSSRSAGFLTQKPGPIHEHIPKDSSQLAT